MAQYKIPNQNVTLNFSDEGVIYRTDPTQTRDTVIIRKGSNYYTLPKSQYTGNYDALPMLTITGDEERAIQGLYGSNPSYQIGDPSMFAAPAPVTGQVYEQRISPVNPQAADVVNLTTGETVKTAPSIEENLMAAGATPEQAASLGAAAKQNQGAAYTPAQLATAGVTGTPSGIIPTGGATGVTGGTTGGATGGGGGTPSAPPVIAAPGGQVSAPAAGTYQGGQVTTQPVGTPVQLVSPTDIATLQGNVQLEQLGTKLDELALQISAGIASTSQTQILESLFQKFGVQEQMDLLNSYNQLIFQQQKVLKELPEAIQRSLEDVGVSQNQLTRLIAKESIKPMQALNEAMQLAGVAQDRINQSLQFVSMFSDAAIADQAAKIEAIKFQFDYFQGKFREMKEDQRFAIGIALDERKGVLSIAAQAAQNGAPANVVSTLASAKSIPEALVNAGQWLNPNLQDEKGKIQTLATQAAQNGAPSDIVQRVAQSQTYTEALYYAGSYVQAPKNPEVQQFGNSYYQWNSQMNRWEIIQGISSPANLADRTYNVVGSDGKMHTYRDVMNADTGQVVSHTDLGVSQLPKTDTTGSTTLEDFRILYGRDPVSQQEYLNFISAVNSAQRKSETGIQPSSGFTTYDVEKEAREDAVQLIQSGNTPEQAYKTLRTLFGSQEASNSALASLVGYQLAGTEDTETQSTLPGEIPQGTLSETFLLNPPKPYNPYTGLTY